MLYDLQEGVWEKRETCRTIVNVGGIKKIGFTSAERFGQAVVLDDHVFLFGRKEHLENGKIKIHKELSVLNLLHLNEERKKAGEQRDRKKNKNNTLEVKYNIQDLRS